MNFEFINSPSFKNINYPERINCFAPLKYQTAINVQIYIRRFFPHHLGVNRGLMKKRIIVCAT